MSQQFCSQVVSFFRNLFSSPQSQPAGAAAAAPVAAPAEESAGLVLPPAKPGETGVARYHRALEEAQMTGVQRYLNGQS